MNLETNSLGFNKKPSETTVVVAMSGGVDSSTVAGMMKQEGYNVIGITLKLYNDGKEVAASKQCCSGQDIMDAKRVAHKLDIEHKILYYQDKFKQGVIDNFVESYLKGETPIPCVQCNQTVKLKDLFEFSKDLNADALITGHYVKSLTQDNLTNMYQDDNDVNDVKMFNQTTLFNLNANTDNKRYTFFSMDAGIGVTTKDFWLFGGTGNFNALAERTTLMDNVMYGVRDVDFPMFKPIVKQTIKPGPAVAATPSNSSIEILLSFKAVSIMYSIFSR